MITNRQETIEHKCTLPSTVFTFIWAMIKLPYRAITEMPECTRKPHNIIPAPLIITTSTFR